MTDPLHPKADGPQMPEPLALVNADDLLELSTCNAMRVQCGNPPVYDDVTAKAEGLVPVITAASAQAYAEALAAHRVAPLKVRILELEAAHEDASGAILEAVAAERGRCSGSVPDQWLVKVRRLVEGFEHVSGIARLWEPDHSSGSERALWSRATEACADVAKLLHATQPPATGKDQS